MVGVMAMSMKATISSLAFTFVFVEAATTTRTCDPQERLAAARRFLLVSLFFRKRILSDRIGCCGGLLEVGKGKCRVWGS